MEVPLYTEEDKKENSYYLADSKGIPIWKSDSICTDDKTDGEKRIFHGLL